MTEDDVYLPTPEEIAETCRQIREGWSEEDFAVRSFGKGRKRWRLPVIHLLDEVRDLVSAWNSDEGETARRSDAA